jgi:hypothetical protein
MDGGGNSDCAAQGVVIAHLAIGCTVLYGIAQGQVIGGEGGNRTLDPGVMNAVL